jgi:hypothetical protein
MSNGFVSVRAARLHLGELHIRGWGEAVDGESWLASAVFTTPDA